MWDLEKAHFCLTVRQAVTQVLGAPVGVWGAPGQSTDGWTGPRVKGKQLRGKQSTSPSQKMKKQRLQIRAAHPRPDHTSGVQAVSRRQEAGGREDPMPGKSRGPCSHRAEGKCCGPRRDASGRTPEGAGVSRRNLCPHDQRCESLKLETNQVSTN